MKRIRYIPIIILILLMLVQPVNADAFSAPEVPESGSPYMPDQITSFGEGLWYVVKSAITVMKPSLAEAARLCLSMIAIALLASIFKSISERIERTLQIATATATGILLLQTTNSMVNLGTSTITSLSQYGKLLIPVMTAAMASQGQISSSTAMYTGTTLFTTVLTNLIARLIVPLIYIFLCLCISNSAIGEDTLKRMQDFVKWLITWILKTVLYIFTGYISITGVVSGSVDASMVKATKLTISGTVPVVGSILSDASESILVSAGLMKNTVGVYGVLAIAATFIHPFLQIGTQYLLMKLTAAACGIFGDKNLTVLMQGFTTCMGFILAIICSISILLLIGVVCMMRGIT